MELHLFPAALIVTTHFVVGVKRLRRITYTNHKLLWAVSAYILCEYIYIYVIRITPFWFSANKKITQQTRYYRYTIIYVYIYRRRRVKSDVINVFLSSAHLVPVRYTYNGVRVCRV